MPDVLFTVEQANAALPLVGRIMKDVVALEERISEATTAYRALRERPDKPQAPLNDARRVLGELVVERDACVVELTELGVRLGDAALGVCDFPSELDGRPILLCWAVGEARVEHYHAHGAGYAGRRPLPVPVTTG